jgi:hypothetical protein
MHFALVFKGFLSFTGFVVLSIFVQTFSTTFTFPAHGDNPAMPKRYQPRRVEFSRGLIVRAGQ